MTHTDGVKQPAQPAGTARTASAASENRHSQQLPPSTAPAGRHGLTTVNTATGGRVSGLLSPTYIRGRRQLQPNDSTQDIVPMKVC